jgi:hypothetical protein
MRRRQRNSRCTGGSAAGTGEVMSSLITGHSEAESFSSVPEQHVKRRLI